MSVEAQSARFSKGSVRIDNIPLHNVGLEPGSGIGSIESEVLGGINEGPVRSLEGTVTITNRLDMPEPTSLGAKAAADEAESIAKAKAIWEDLKLQPSLTSDMLKRAYLAQEAIRRTKVAEQKQISPVASLQGADSAPYLGHVHIQTEHSLKSQAHLFEQQTKKTHYAAVEERIEAKRRRFVLDEGAMGVVIAEFRIAVRKAKEWALGLGVKITGPLIKRFLPGQHPGNESEAVRGKGADGAIPERAEAIGKHGEFTSDLEADKVSVEEAIKRPSVRIEQDGHGKRVTEEDVYRVFQNHEVKPVFTEADEVEIKTELRIEDYPDLEAALTPEFLLIDRLNKEG